MSPAGPRRSVIFFFPTGEEKGLLGSRYYLDNPVVPLHRTVANLNVDGVAFFSRFRDVVGIGGDLSTLGDDLEAVATALRLQVSPLPKEFRATEAFLYSDQLAFAEAGIPSILVLEGLDYEGMTRAQALEQVVRWGRDYYHTPFDDAEQPLNLEAAVQHTELLLRLAHRLSNASEEPAWHPGSPFINIRLRSQAEGR